MARSTRSGEQNGNITENIVLTYKQKQSLQPWVMFSTEYTRWAKVKKFATLSCCGKTNPDDSAPVIFQPGWHLLYVTSQEGPYHSKESLSSEDVIRRFGLHVLPYHHRAANRYETMAVDIYREADVWLKGNWTYVCLFRKRYLAVIQKHF